MIKTKQDIKYKLKRISKDRDVDFNFILRSYMYDRFIVRLSESKYKDNFIIKGGFYLSTLFGVEKRNTMDIDTALIDADFTEDNIVNMVKEIIEIEIDDNVLFKISKIESIRDNDEYGGLRITLNFSLQKYNDKLHIDIATGDLIHPGPIEYGYNSLINNEKYKVWVYSIETSLAEKMETALSKLETSSRMKDYYDIYLIYHNEFENIDLKCFKEAVNKTFNKRKFNGDLLGNLDIVRNSKTLQSYWKAYSRKNKYAKNISF